MNSTLKSLRNAARFLAVIGLFALTTTEDITGAWLQAGWLMLIASFILDRYPQRQGTLRRGETFAVIFLIAMSIADLFVLKNSFFVVVAHFLQVFQTFKLMGLKERKDCLQMGLIGFFQLLAACTLSADVWQAALLFLFIPGGTALLFWNYAARVAEEANPSTPWPEKPLKRLHAGISLSALPLNLLMTIAVFILFPRLTFNLHVPGFGAGRSAYTDQMNLAQNGTIGQDSTVAIWLSFADEEQRGLWNGYLRGDVLDSFNGKQWVNSHGEKQKILQPDRNEAYQIQRPAPGLHPLHAKMTLLNTTKSTLFTPGSPVQIIVPLPRLDTTDAGDFHWNTPMQHPLQFQILVVPGERTDPATDAALLSTLYMELPDHGLDRTRTLALSVAGDGEPLQKAMALESYLQTHYRYSTDLGQEIPDNPVDAFLFERRQGFCIHFASALAVMLRLNGIPARVVAGYYHGEWNPLAQEILFREKDAHAWVEAWVKDRWVTLDASPRAVFEGEARRATRLWRLHLRETWDYLGYEWNRIVIEYDLYSQLRAWERLRSHSDRLGGRWSREWMRWRNHLLHTSAHETSSGDNATEASDPNTSKGSKVSTAIGVLIRVALLSLLIAVGYRKAVRTEVPDFYLRFLRKMSRSGVAKEDAETAAEFAYRAVQRLPKQADHIREVTRSYYRVRFGKK
jgi:hypothetical protein